MDVFIRDLMAKMAIEEKIGQLSLINFGLGSAPGAPTANCPQGKIKNGHIGPNSGELKQVKTNWLKM
jgi:hypothetical protein